MLSVSKMELQEKKVEPEEKKTEPAENENSSVPLNISSDVENSANKENFFTFIEDVPDIPPKSSEISNFDLFFLILSIVTHCTDVGVDINIVLQYYLNDKLNMFLWTIALILVPSFINTVVSLQMYHQDKKVFNYFSVTILVDCYVLTLYFLLFFRTILKVDNAKKPFPF